MAILLTPDVTTVCTARARLAWTPIAMSTEAGFHPAFADEAFDSSHGVLLPFN